MTLNDKREMRWKDRMKDNSLVGFEDRTEARNHERERSRMYSRKKEVPKVVLTKE